MAKKILLFDIDATLLLTGGAGQIAFDEAFFHCFGIKDAWGDTKPHGKTDPVIFQEIALRVLGRRLSGEETERLSGRYLDRFPSALEEAPRFRLMPGIPRLLEDLSRRQDVLLGVATGNYERSTWAKLERGKLRHFFAFAGSASDSKLRDEIVRTAIERAGAKLDGDLSGPHDIIVIGDTPMDIASGKANGARTVGVATGLYTYDQLKACSPDFCFRDFSDSGAFMHVLD